MKICYWSIAWGEYRYMLQALVNSFREVGMTDDFHVWVDGPFKHATSTNKPVEDIKFDQLQFFKFHYLKQEVRKLGDYDAFVFIDADHFYVRKPTKSIEQILGTAPWHSFLESPINAATTRRMDWWSCPNDKIVKLFREHGIESRIIYNSNGGHWICHREFIDDAHRFALEFHEDCAKVGHRMPEEVAICWLTHYMSADLTPRLVYNYFDYWGSDWTGQFKDRLPDGSVWDLEDYMTGMKFKVNPSLVHAMRSKKALVEKGREILGEKVQPIETSIVQFPINQL